MLKRQGRQIYIDKKIVLSITIVFVLAKLLDVKGSELLSLSITRNAYSLITALFKNNILAGPWKFYRTKQKSRGYLKTGKFCNFIARVTFAINSKIYNDDLYNTLLVFNSTKTSVCAHT